MAKYFRLLIVVLLFTSCSINDTFEIEPSMSIDARLPKDKNGYYHLKLNPSSNQTIHTITGSIENINEPTKVLWWSNLVWYYNGEEVPTTNISSYSNENGDFSNVIAPIYSMKGDTLIVNAIISKFNLIEKIEIVLE